MHEAQQVLLDFDVSLLKMLGLLDAYRAIHTTKPEYASDKLRELLGKRHPQKLSR